MSAKPRFRRRRYFLRGTSQPALLVSAQLIFIGSIVITSVVLLLVANRDLTESYFSAHLAIRNLREILLPTLVAVDLLGLVVSSALLVFYTHRVAGPSYRLCRILERVAAGDLSQRVRLRKGDYLQDVAASTDAMIRQMNARLSQLRIEAQHLEDQWGRFQGQTPSSEAIEAMEATIHRLQEQLQVFQLE